HLLEFYAGIGEDPEGSAIQHIEQIGQKASRFKAVLDLLPDHWTTIYNLALLPDDKFATLIQDGRLTPLVTWKELSSHVIEAKPKPPKKPRPRLTLELDDVPLSKRGKFVKEMTEMCQKFSVPLPKEQR